MCCRFASLPKTWKRTERAKKERKVVRESPVSLLTNTNEQRNCTDLQWRWRSLDLDFTESKKNHTRSPVYESINILSPRHHRHLPSRSASRPLQSFTFSNAYFSKLLLLTSFKIILYIIGLEQIHAHCWLFPLLITVSNCYILDKIKTGVNSTKIIVVYSYLHWVLTYVNYRPLYLIVMLVIQWFSISRIYFSKLILSRSFKINL